MERGKGKINLLELLLENSPIGVESCGKDSCSMGSGGGGRKKEKKKDTRTTESVDNVATIPQQRR